MKKSMGKILTALALALSFGLSSVACALNPTSSSGNNDSVDSGDSSSSSSTEQSAPQFKEEPLSNVKNVILLIGDGMGPNHVKASEIYKGAPLAMQSMPFSAYSLTSSANNQVTDSAAGATALATGVRTNNGYVGVDAQGKELTTIMDIAMQEGKRTGVVTTDTMSGATPMAFVAHCADRKDSVALLNSAVESGVNLLVSTSNEAEGDFQYNGYSNLPDVADISEEESDYVLGTYGILASAPSGSAEMDNVALDRVVSESIEYLSKDDDGFVLMVEGAKIDKHAERNNLEYTIAELLAFDDAVQTALDFAKDRDDTVVIVTADHETGGLSLEEGFTKENMAEKHSWSTHGHTAANVYCNVYAKDFDFLRFSSEEKTTELKNADIFTMMKTFVQGYQQASLTVKQNSAVGGEVTVDKTSFCYAEKIKIMVKVNAGYRLTSFKINEKECINDLKATASLEYVVDKSRMEIKMLFVKDM